MIRINRQTDYAVRLILYLAQQAEGVRVSTAEVRKEMQIPPALAQRIVADLARGEFIQTYPGRDGGLVLARTAEKINLRQIVEHFEGKFFISDCLVDKGNCPFDNNCPVRFRWAKLQSQMVLELEQITFKELAQDAMAVNELFSMHVPETAGS
jgi:Rrf2 family nitric oxide-sensitive transcriptional repressor